MLQVAFFCMLSTLAGLATLQEPIHFIFYFFLRNPRFSCTCLDIFWCILNFSFVYFFTRFRCTLLISLVSLFILFPTASLLFGGSILLILPMLFHLQNIQRFWNCPKGFFGGSFGFLLYEDLLLRFLKLCRMKLSKLFLRGVLNASADGFFGVVWTKIYFWRLQEGKQFSRQRPQEQASQ